MNAKRLLLCVIPIILSFSFILTGIALAQTPEPPSVPDVSETASDNEAAGAVIIGAETNPRISTTENSFNAELLAFERAYNQGPEAILALRDS